VALLSIKQYYSPLLRAVYEYFAQASGTRNSVIPCETVHCSVT
jgi:hypothetical protein